jgi:hypothetical protein
MTEVNHTLFNAILLLYDNYYDFFTGCVRILKILILCLFLLYFYYLIMVITLWGKGISIHALSKAFLAFSKSKKRLEASSWGFP